MQNLKGTRTSELIDLVHVTTSTIAEPRERPLSDAEVSVLFSDIEAAISEADSRPSDRIVAQAMRRYLAIFQLRWAHRKN